MTTTKFDERVTIMMEQVGPRTAEGRWVADVAREALQRRLWLWAAADVTVAEVHGSWHGVPEAAWAITFYGSTTQVDAVVADVAKYAAEHGQDAILVDRQKTDAVLVWTAGGGA